MGTNAIPTLLKWISYQRSSAEGTSQTGPTGPASDANHSPTLTPEERARRALYAFRFLGAMARPAIPQLTQLTRSSSDADRADRCAESLAAIGPEAIPSLLSLATNGPPLTRWYVVAALEFFALDPAVVPAVPVLIECLGDTNENARISEEAGTVLGLIHPPAVVVPALTNALRSPAAHMRRQAAWCLAAFEGEAGSVVPAFRAAMRDPDYQVRVTATNILRRMGGWELVGEQWVRRHGTNTLHGITPDFFTNVPSR
jgi:HEAT repeat protein